MSCLLDRQTLDNFRNNYIIPTLKCQRADFLQSCTQRCQEIISAYRPAFPDDCAQLDFLFWLEKHNLISVNDCLIAMHDVVQYMSNHFDEIYKAPKIFISHSTDDRLIVEKFVTMLEQMGVKQNQLFCSSVAGYGIPQGAGDLYEFIRNEMGNDNMFVIMMLSQNYYSSPVCLNEMGAAWVKQSAYQSILLPGFRYSEIKGAVNPRDITFCLDDRDNRNYALNELRDRIVKHLGISDIEQNCWERFRNKFIEEVDYIIAAHSLDKELTPAPNPMEQINTSTDDEKVILYYILSKKVRKLKKPDVELWLRTDEIYNVNVENAFDLLSTIGNSKIAEETLELDINVFRELVASDKKMTDDLQSCFLQHRWLSGEHFVQMWENGKFDDAAKLFIAYITDERVSSLGNRWMADAQIEDIKRWEDKCDLDEFLSQNYGTCLGFFVQNRFVYESDWTSYGNPREYRLCPSLENLLFSEQFLHIDEIEQIKQNHIFQLPF